MISVIIPTLNEEDNIVKLLKHLVNTAKGYITEILVVDGGSTDNTTTLVNNYTNTYTKSVTSKRCLDQIVEQPVCINIRVINSDKGRAKQMNTGAKQAKGKVLYFLHADSFPPHHFDYSIIKAIKAKKLAGCFKMKFTSNHWWLKLASWLTQLNIMAARGGDQSLFVDKELFFDIGLYNENFKIYEDNDLIKRLYAKNAFTVITSKWITSSARRYEENGVWRLQYHFWVIHLKKRFGASPDELYAYYKTNIA